MVSFRALRRSMCAYGWERVMYQRILIMGPPGSGKSTLARRMGQVSGLPVVHLDAMFWQPGWQEPDDDEFQERVREAAERPRWIMDGGYSRTLKYRLPRAELVIYLDLPRRIYLPAVIRRWIQHRNRTRPDMGRGCPEKIDLEFLRYVWRYPKDARSRQLSHLTQRPPNVEMRCLRSRAEMENFLSEFSTLYAAPDREGLMVS